MKVQEVLLGENRKRYILINDKGCPIVPVAQYLKALEIMGRSINTQKTYCHALKRYYDFLLEYDIPYDQISMNDLANFLGWLRIPHYDQSVVFLNEPKLLCNAKTANLILTVVCSYYDFLYRNHIQKNNLSDTLAKTVFSGGPRKYKDFLYHVTKDKPIVRYYLSIKEPKDKITILSKQEIECIYHAATNNCLKQVYALERPFRCMLMTSSAIMAMAHVLN